jgi:hypothetical protein
VVLFSQVVLRRQVILSSGVIDGDVISYAMLKGFGLEICRASQKIGSVMCSTLDRGPNS